MSRMLSGFENVAIPSRTAAAMSLQMPLAGGWPSGRAASLYSQAK